MLAPPAHPSSLLRHEVGEVANPRAWADPGRLTPDLLALYRRPLHVEGWDAALVAVRAECAASGAPAGALQAAAERDAAEEMLQAS